MTRTDEQNANLLVWADALESGEWSQGQERLKTVDVHGTEYCCLGVLCELHDVTLYPDDPDLGSFGVRLTDDGDTSHDALPRRVKEACGLEPRDISACITMNDDMGYNFEQIAQVVRRAVEDDVKFRVVLDDIAGGAES